MGIAVTANYDLFTMLGLVANFIRDWCIDVFLNFVSYFCHICSPQKTHSLFFITKVISTEEGTLDVLYFGR